MCVLMGLAYSRESVHVRTMLRLERLFIVVSFFLLLYVIDI